MYNLIQKFCRIRERKHLIVGTGWPSNFWYLLEIIYLISLKNNIISCQNYRKLKCNVENYAIIRKGTSTGLILNTKTEWSHKALQ